MARRCELLDSFVSGGCYCLKEQYDNMFVCMPAAGNSMGKLVQYRKQTPTMWERTGITHFLNIYFDNDVKELFLNRDNYDMIGRLGDNYELSADEDYVLRREHD